MSGTTGLTRWRSKPAACDFSRSFVLAPAGHGDEQARLAPGPLAQGRATSCPLIPGSPMSRRTISGRKASASLEGGGAVVGRPDLLAVEQPQHPRQAVGGIDIVVHDEDAARRGLSPSGRRARRFVAGAGDGAGRGPAGGRRTRCPGPARRSGP